MWWCVEIAGEEGWVLPEMLQELPEEAMAKGAEGGDDPGVDTLADLPASSALEAPPPGMGSRPPSFSGLGLSPVVSSSVDAEKSTAL